jgi:hypothetical protein
MNLLRSSLGAISTQTVAVQYLYLGVLYVGDGEDEYPFNCRLDSYPCCAVDLRAVAYDSRTTLRTTVSDGVDGWRTGAVVTKSGSKWSSRASNCCINDSTNKHAVSRVAIRVEGIAKNLAQSKTKWETGQ